MISLFLLAVHSPPAAAQATGLTLTVSPTTVDEGDGSNTITATATLTGGTNSTATTLSVTILDTAPPNSNLTPATLNTDYTHTLASNNNTITIAANQTTGSLTFDVTAKIDTEESENESIIVQASDAGTLTAYTAITIRDPDVVLSVSPTSLKEDAGETTVTVTATLRETSATATTLTLGLWRKGLPIPPDHTPAHVHTDYTHTLTLNSPLTVPASTLSVSTTFTVTPKVDAEDNEGESIIVRASLGNSTYLTTIRLYDRTIYTLSVSPVTLDEKDGATSVTVTAKKTSGQAPSSATSVPLTLAGTATSGTDYTVTPTAPTLTIPTDGSDASTTLTIDPTDDTATVECETIFVSGTAGGMTLIPVTLRLIDGDSPCFSTSIATHVLYSAQSTSQTVTLPSAETATGSLTYTFSATPAWLTFDASGPSLTVAASTTPKAAGRYTLTATNTASQTATTTISVAVIQDQCSGVTTWYPTDADNTPVTPSTDLIRDCNILLAAKALLEGANNSVLPWDITNRMGTWNVGVAPGYIRIPATGVKKIIQPSHRLKGVIPQVLGGMTHLDEITLYQSSDSFPLTGGIPKELGSLTKLKHLSLVDNALSGPIPRELGDLANLEVLQLGRNQLHGPIPPALSRLAKLTDLQVGTNTLGKDSNDVDISNPVPPDLGKLTNLKVLELDGNQLRGSIPSALGKLKKLTRLNLACNFLTADSTTLGGMTALERLSFNNNALTGSIPQDLGSLSALTFLDLANLNLNVPAGTCGTNTLSGAIPTTWGSTTHPLSNLESLYLHGNQLSGAIPPAWGSTTHPLPNLERLSLYDNQLSGTIPPALGKLTNLKYLYLDGNQLSGAIPTTWGSTSHPLPNLERLDLRDNDLSGTIPANLGKLGEAGTTPHSLDWLFLSGNRLSGAIPSGWGSTSHPLTDLQALYLHQNLLTGSIPTAFKDLSALFAFRFDSNQSTCLPDDTTLRTWYKALTNYRYKDTVEVHCAFTAPPAAPTLTAGSGQITVAVTTYGGTFTDPYDTTQDPHDTDDYEVQYRPYETGRWQSPAADSPCSPTPSTSCTLTGLTEGQSYEVRYRARTAANTAPGLTPDPDDPAKPGTNRRYGSLWSPAATARAVSLTVPQTSVTYTSATLTIDNWTLAWWYKGGQSESNTQGEANSQSEADCIPVAADTPTTTISGLTPNTEYTYTAYSDADCTTPITDAVTFTTTPTTTVSPPGGGVSVSEPAPLQKFFESPVDGAVVSGVDVIRGWTFAEDRGVKIAQVELYLDGQRAAIIPCCSARADVSAQFPTFPRANTGQSGWGITWNWGNLTPGRHTVRVRVTGTDEGRWVSDRHTITVLKPGDIAFADRFSLAAAQARIEGSHLVLDGVVLRDKVTQAEQAIVARYAWQTGAQGLRLVASRTLQTARPQPLGLERLLARLWHWLSPRRVTANAGLTAFYEAPADHAQVVGIDIIRGWAFPDDPTDTIATVTVQIDDTPGSAPCCSTRADVAGAFPAQANAELSGWGVVTNYGNLAAGEHTLTVQIETEAGVEYTAARTVTVSRLGGYAFVDRFDLSGAEVELEGEEVVLSGVRVRDKATQEWQTITVWLQWSVAVQGLVMVDTAIMP